MSNPAPEDSIPSTPVPPPENVLGTPGEGDLLSTPAPPENVFSTPGEDNVSSTPAPPENILDAPGEDNVLAAPAPPDNVFSTPEDNITSTLAPPENVFATPVQDNVPLQPPTPLTDLTPLETSPRDSFTPSAAPLVPENEKGLDEEGLDGKGLVVGGLAGGSLDEKGLDETGLEENVVDKPEPRRSLFKRPIFWFVAAALIAAVVLAVILPVYFTVIRPKNNTSTGGGNPNPDGGDDGGNDSGTPTPPSNGLTTGGDGSTITMENGTEFTYRNPFGGFCASRPLSRMQSGLISYFKSQGSGIQQTLSATTLGQIRGRLLSIRPGDGESTSYTGKRRPPHTHHPPFLIVFSALFRHTAHP